MPIDTSFRRPSAGMMLPLKRPRDADTGPGRHGSDGRGGTQSGSSSASPHQQAKTDSASPASSVHRAETSAFSCERCAKRKVKCDKLQPRCSACVRQGAECTPSQPTSADRPRKKRFPEAELLHRIDVYERALRRLGLDVDEVREGKADLSLASASPASQQQRARRNGTTTRDPSPAEAHEDYNQFSALFKDCVDGKKTVDTDEGKNPERHVLKFLDEVWQEDGSLSLLYPPGDAADERAAAPDHPSPFQILNLWQVYLDNAHPVIKVLHAPTMQKKVVDMVAKLSEHGSKDDVAPNGSVNHSKPSFTASDQALIFAMYTAAVCNCHPEDFKSAIGTTRSREEWMQQMRKATRYWLYKCNIYRTSELQVLQALILFLSVLGAAMDPRTLCSFTGLSDRLARRIGLHRDRPAKSDSDPVEVEMRRRIWWEVVLLDQRALEKAGLGSSGLDNNWRVRLPSGVGDTDLATHNGPATPRGTASSEMIFFLVRCEIASFLHEIRLSQGRDVGWTEFSTPQRSLKDKIAQIDELEQLMQERYLVHCDPVHAIQRLAIVFCQGLLSKMRLSAYISEESQQARSAGDAQKGSQGANGTSGTRPAGSQAAHRLTPSTIALRTDMITLCTDALSLVNELLCDPALRRFHSFLHGNKPFVAVLHLLRLLRDHTEGPPVERAWQVLNEAQWMFKGTTSAKCLDKAPMRVRTLICPLLLTAWEARKAAKGQSGREDPPWIANIRMYAARAFMPEQLDARPDAAGRQGIGASNGISTAQAAPRELAVAQTLASQMIDQNSLFTDSDGQPLDVAASERLILPLDESLSAPSIGFSSSTALLDNDFDWEEWFRSSLLGEASFMSGGVVV
ncbi:hypothetical protein BCV69DRAFT_78463 [Microstroma glucosiphilum]|uniref:Zn(2)-C6 fungal-type domain-containing protein n=1 Tax=Pseudomicrostroma glucosiphilum TaxID=1684307 RepID=A0A316TYT0_9BASI|nr:hypothetical protein BCV69DRAFT_78463 [Pseudomicrostroma glucosiphilum]PWN18210.1 hypothetical protein BCV69DRAFT_78463 [Pseudomicrostroma glucosiphilum]